MPSDYRGKVIWDKPSSPNVPFVRDALSLDKGTLRERLHDIKDAANLSPSDRVVIYETGYVVDKANGNDIGNLCDG